MMRPSTFFFLTRRGVRNLGKHWAMTIACIASLSVCMTLNIFASLAELVVLPDPCRPAIRITAGGTTFKFRPPSSAPSSLTSSSCTILTTSCPG